MGTRTVHEGTYHATINEDKSVQQAVRDVYNVLNGVCKQIDIVRGVERTFLWNRQHGGTWSRDDLYDSLQTGDELQIVLETELPRGPGALIIEYPPGGAYGGGGALIHTSDKDSRITDMNTQVDVLGQTRSREAMFTLRVCLWWVQNIDLQKMNRITNGYTKCAMTLPREGPWEGNPAWFL
jgi:hypothetical protein